MNYSLVMRGNPRYPERGKKVYASAQTDKTLSMGEFIDGIVFHGSSFSRGELMGVMADIFDELASKLQEGYRVNFDDFGQFYPTLDCDGAPSMEEFDPNQHIKGIRVNWEPDKKFKNLREGVNFELKSKKCNQKKVMLAERRGETTVDIG